VTETSGGNLTMDFLVRGASPGFWQKWIKTPQGSSGAEVVITSVIQLRIVHEPYLE